MSASTDTVAAARPGASLRWGTIARVLASVAALAIIFGRIPVSEVVSAISRLNPAWALAAVASVYAAIAVSVAKWQVLLRARGYRLGSLRLARHYLVGLFFNNFLPTSVGGDVVRAWDAGRDLDDAPEGAASVIAERLIASVALGLTAAIGLPFVEAGPQAALAVAIVVVASLVLAGLFLSPTRSARMVRNAMSGRFEGVADWVARTVAGVGETLRKPGAVAVVLGLSIVFQIFVALVNFCLFRALGSGVPIGECVVYTSIVSAVTMVPISISGHGVREAGYVYFFGLAGVAAPITVTASILFFATVALCTLPGAFFFMRGRRP